MQHAQGNLYRGTYSRGKDRVIEVLYWDDNRCKWVAKDTQPPFRTVYLSRDRLRVRYMPIA